MPLKHHAVFPVVQSGVLGTESVPTSMVSTSADTLLL